MLEQISRITGQQQIEAILKHALNEQSIECASPMTDVEVTLFVKTVKEKTTKMDIKSNFIHTILEMANLILKPSDGIPGPEYVFWARKMLRKFQELFLMLHEIGSSSNRTKNTQH